MRDRSYPEIADGGITMPRLIFCACFFCSRCLCLLAVTTTVTTVVPPFTSYLADTLLPVGLILEDTWDTWIRGVSTYPYRGRYLENSTPPRRRSDKTGEECV